jgi:hypothetical protein
MVDCIYCQLQNTDPSAEHVVADSLGGSIELRPECVCKRCNNRFDQEIDRAVQADLAPILAPLAIPGKRGAATKWMTTEVVGGEERKFLVRKNEIIAAEPRKLLGREGGAYHFRATSRELLEQARDEIMARNLGKQVQLSEIVERVPDLPESRVDFVDFSAPHWTRWAAKTCLNVICYFLGQSTAARLEFDDLRTLALHGGGKCPPDLYFGGIGEDVQATEDTPLRHRLLVCTTTDDIYAGVTLFDFCGFQFGRRVCALSPSGRELVLDAFNKCISRDVSI